MAPFVAWPGMLFPNSRGYTACCGPQPPGGMRLPVRPGLQVSSSTVTWMVTSIRHAFLSQKKSIHFASGICLVVLAGSQNVTGPGYRAKMKRERGGENSSDPSQSGKRNSKKRAKVEIEKDKIAVRSEAGELQVEENSTGQSSIAAGLPKSDVSSHESKAKPNQKRVEKGDSKSAGSEKSCEAAKTDSASVQTRMINHALGGARKGPTKDKVQHCVSASDPPSHSEAADSGHSHLKRDTVQKHVEPPSRVQKNPDFLHEHRTRYVEQKTGRVENRKVKFIHGNYDSYYNYRNPGPPCAPLSPSYSLPFTYLSFFPTFLFSPPT